MEVGKFTDKTKWRIRKFQKISKILSILLIKTCLKKLLLPKYILFKLNPLSIRPLFSTSMRIGPHFGIFFVRPHGQTITKMKIASLSFLPGPKPTWRLSSLL